MKIGEKQVIQYFLKKSLTEKLYFFTLIITNIAVIILPLTTTIYYKNIIDTLSIYVSGDKTHILNQIIFLLCIVLAIKLTTWIFYRLTEYAIVKLEINVMKKVYMECFQYVHAHSYRFFTNTFGGALVKKVSKLVRAYEATLDTFIFQIMPTFVGMIFIMAVVFSQNNLIGIIFLGRILFYTGVLYLLYKKKLPYDVEANVEDSQVIGHLADTITNHFNVLTFSSQKREFITFKKVLESRGKKTGKSWFKSNVINMIQAALMIFFEFTIFFIAFKLWGFGLITVGTILLLQLYMMKIFENLFTIGYTFKRLYMTISESTEMIEILQTPHEIIDQNQAKSLKVSKGKIVFDEVCFNYGKGNKLFDKLSFKIDALEKVAFVGESGVGKSTILKLLFRFFDISKGKILIDGQNIFEVTQESLRDQISIVPQEPILFHRTIKENIAYGKPNASEKEIFIASKIARCHDFVMKLEKGYDTLVGERGIKLSGGERQRIAIARAILENKKILVLDEATSSLDSQSESLIQEAIQEVMKNKTCIVIAHRLSTIMNMDRIIVLGNMKNQKNVAEKKGKQGRDDQEIFEGTSYVAETGTHQELLKKKNGIYKKLWNIQSGGFIS